MLLTLLALAPFLASGLTVAIDQRPLLAAGSNREREPPDQSRVRPLHGRFLHITDFHPDQFYKPWSSTESEQDCHRGSGAAGIYGAETTDCDSPFTLVNATFQWINDNLKDTIDFVVWTGDSARHDADERLPRTEKQVLDLNEMLVNKFTEVFGKDDNINDTDPTNDFIIPIVPNFGNNDIMPHNIMTPGPNFWTKRFLHVWRSMIPEEQRHGFERGGWFFVEVIPNQLAVFSLNTLYFFDNNAAVDGCAKKSEPGFEHMEWLRIQLQFLRKRGMKAILMGHVPPARTDGKQSWDETCWQKYTLWMRQYRDVVVGSVYGHMNIDHFMLQDFEQIKKKTAHGRSSAIKEDNRKSLGEKISIQSSADYLTDLREDWARIPNEPKSMHSSNWLGQFYNLIDVVRKKKHESKKDKYLQEIGGEWAERYSATLVSASVVPNYFPSMRVIEYNITGVDHRQAPEGPIYAGEEDEYQAHGGDDEAHDSASTSRKKHKKKKKHHKKQKFTIPSPPSKSSPPGPAYSPQPFTWTSYTQYYANLTRINNDFHDLVSAPPMPPQQLPDGENTDGDVETEKKKSKWRSGIHHNQKPTKHYPSPLPFTYEIEYSTKNDSVFALPDLTVRSWVNLARRIGKYDPRWGFDSSDAEDVEGTDEDDDEGSVGEQHRRKHKGKGKGGKKKKERKEVKELWFTFLRRAFVGTKDDEELKERFWR